jgi:iron complex transport system substrate-binding protein
VKKLFCLLLFITPFFLYAETFPLTLQDALGKSFTAERPLSRIVSLSPGLTEIIFAIGAGDRLVGVTEFCNYPEDALLITRVGGFSGITVNTEEIVRLRPSAVMLSAFMHSRLIPLLERLNIPVFAVEPRNLEEVYELIENMGHLTGRGDSALLVINNKRDKIRQAQSFRANRERPGVFWEISDEPLMSSGGNTFINEAIHLAGGRNIFADIPSDWITVTHEQILLRNPTWIISGDDHGTRISESALARRPGWTRITAVRNKNIAVINADSIYRYGPRLADAILSLAEILWANK